MKKRIHSPARQRGFALVIALSLMGFILVLLLSITAFVRVESRASATALSQVEAKQNALLGVYIALGELQRAAGPDQRVTATADLLDGTHGSRRHLAGVWDSSNNTFLQWLVSDFDRDGGTVNFVQAEAPNPSAPGNVVLVGDGSVLVDADNPPIVVDLNNTEIQSGIGTVGRYGWWVGDEGVKARVNLDNPFHDSGKHSAVLALNSFNRGETAILSGFEGGTGLQPDEVSKINSLTDFTLTPTPVVEDAVKDQFHHLTSFSAGVLADVRNGGLKRDLSLAFEMSDADFNNSVFSNDGPRTVQGPGVQFHVQPLFYCENDGRGPTWHLLRDYYTIYKRIANPMTDPVFIAQALAPNSASAELNVTTNHIGDDAQFIPAMRFQGHHRANLGVNGDVLRSNSDIPILIRGNYTPYVNRHLTSYAFNFSAIPPPSGAPSGIEYRRPDYVYKSEFVVHNPYNVKVRTHGMFSLAFRQRFTVDFELVNDPSANLNSIDMKQFNQNFMRVGPSTYDPGELRIYAGLSGNNNASFSDEGPADQYLQPLPIYQTINPVEIPVDPNDSGPNVRISVRPFDNSRWVMQNFHHIGTSANPISLSTTRGNFVPNSLSVGADFSHFIWDDYEDWYSDASAGPPPAIYTENFRRETGADPFVFFRFDFFVKPAQDDLRYPAFTHSNPIAPTSTTSNLFTSLPNERTGYPVFSPDRQLETSYLTAGGLDAVESSGTNAFWGLSNTGGGRTSVASIELPTTPPISIGKLQNANLGVFGVMPALAVGNSFASPFLARDQTSGIFDNRIRIVNGIGGMDQRVFHDLSYLANEALWDEYFFSSYSLPYNASADGYVPVLGARGSFNAAFAPDFNHAGVTLLGYLPNTRMRLYAPREALGDVSSKLFNQSGEPKLNAYARAAENLLVAGAFNIHSTSVEAWRSVLSSARNAAIYRSGITAPERYGSDRTPFPRLTQPSAGVYNGTASAASAWGGFTALTDTQVEALAEAIVEELKLRVNDQGRPFMSLGAFVNRKLEDNDFGLAGLLQAAIDKSGINQGFSGGLLDTNLNDPSANFPFSDNINDAENNARSSAVGASANIIQGNILQAIGSFIAPRSDTFRIRSYGEAIHPITGAVSSKAWIEAIYQRVPEPVYPTDLSPANADFWLPEEVERFGRRFQLVSFRWLNEDEI